MELALICVRQVAALFVMIFAGFVCVRTGVVAMDAKKAFSDLLLGLVAPCMILNSYMAEFDWRTLQNLLLAGGLAVLLQGTAILAARLARPLFHGGEAPILRFGCIYSNAGYMGFPLVAALFGQEGLLYASAYLTVFNLLLWSHGCMLLDRGENGEPAPLAVTMRNAVTNPALLAVPIGLVIYCAQIPLPAVLTTPIQMIGDMNTPLAMFITGMMIAGSDLKAVVRSAGVWKVIGMRLVAVPLVGFVLCALLGVSGMAPQVVVLLEACPTAAVTSVFSIRYGYDEQLAAGSVVLTTLLSISTLPVFAGLVQSFL